jgi:hypothetical protein
MIHEVEHAASSETRKSSALRSCADITYYGILKR